MKRKEIQEKIEFPIRGPQEYKEDITFENLVNTPNVLPSDVLHKIIQKESESIQWGTRSGDTTTYYTPTLVVIRKRLEYDDEYYERVQKEEEGRRVKEDSERLQYLRLKAKYDKQDYDRDKKKDMGNNDQ